MRKISQYYTPAHQFSGGPLESLSRARAEFTRVCDAFSVPSSARAICLPFAVRQSDLNLPSLLTDSRGRTESQLWDLISERVNTPPRALSVRNMWHASTLAGQPTLPDATPVTRFDRMLSDLSLLQTQLPPSYQTAVMLYDKLTDATRTERFSHAVLALLFDNPDDLISHIQLLLTAGPTTVPPPPNPPGAAPPATAFLADGAPDDSPSRGDSFLVEVEDNPDDASQAWYVFKRFRAQATCPYRTEGTAFRRPSPSRDIPCHNCGVPDPFARTRPSPRRSDLSPPARAHLTSPHNLSSDLPVFTPTATPASPDATTDPPASPSQLPPARDYDAAWIAPPAPIATVYATSERSNQTAITDTGTPGDIVGDAWLRRNPQLFTGPVRPPATSYALGNDVHASLGRVAMRRFTRTSDGRPLLLDLPDVHILRHDAVPLHVILQSHTRIRLLVDTAADILYAGFIRAPIPCRLRRGQRTLLPAPRPAPSATAYYTCTEIQQAHRQFGHASVEAITRASPPDAFTAADVANLKAVTDTCIPCQQHDHLPRHPRHALPNPPHAFHRMQNMDVFQLTPTLSKVLDITDLHTDFGQGRFFPSMRGEIIISALYLAWFSIWGPCETLITVRGSENENDALLHAINSMGIHWRPSPTEAPWSIGRNERHHGPIRDAFTRIQAEPLALAPDLALAMACKARNDAPRAHGLAPTTAFTRDLPRLLIGDNHHADPTIAGRHAAMQSARATMERYTAAERLQGALSHPGTNVPFVSVDQEVWLHRHRLGWLRGRVHSLDGKTVYIQRDGTLFSSHEARTKL